MKLKYYYIDSGDNILYFYIFDAVDDGVSVFVSCHRVCVGVCAL